MVPGGVGPCPELWLRCGPECVEFFLKITDLVNPDPTSDLVFDHISIVNRTLYAAPLVGQTAGESIKAISGKLSGGAGPGSAIGRAAGSPTPEPAAASRQTGRIRLELWHRRDGVERLEATIGEFDAGQVHLGDLVRGGLLRLAPGVDRTGRPSLTMETPYGIGTRAPEAIDRDQDGTPDLLDNCLEAANRGQVDTDGDGFGNACDADLDEDGVAGERDLARVRQCAAARADVSVDLPIQEPEWFDGERLGGSPSEPDPLTVAVAAACRGADIDGDGGVGARDVKFAQNMLGRRPGPSALARGFPVTPPSFAPVCAGGAAITRARVTLAGLEQKPGRQRVRLEGELPVPQSPPVDPLRNGIAFTVRDGRGDTLLDVAIPGGDDWTRAVVGELVVYTHRGGAPGIDEVEVRAGRGPVGIRVSGDRMDVRVSEPELPLLWQVSFDPQAVATLQCGETGFGLDPRAPSCIARGRKTGTVDCR
jgi:hypothetical protein